MLLQSSHAGLLLFGQGQSLVSFAELHASIMTRTPSTAVMGQVQVKDEDSRGALLSTDQFWDNNSDFVKLVLVSRKFHDTFMIKKQA